MFLPGHRNPFSIRFRVQEVKIPFYINTPADIINVVEILPLLVDEKDLFILHSQYD